MTDDGAPRRMISVLVPVFNEAETLGPFLARMRPVLDEIERRFGGVTELVFTDNCSSDRTLALILQHMQEEPRIRAFSFAKNVGFQRSIITGYSRVRGDACAQIDCDLEDPPELILEFVQRWTEGYRVVYGVRRERHERFYRRWARDLFYRGISLLSDVSIPRHAGDFRLIDRRVIEIVCRVNDSQPYLRGLIAALGFKQIGIPYDRSPRHAGTSSFNIMSYISLALDGLLQTSVRPLYLISVIGLLALITSLLLASFYVVAFLLHGPEEPGFFSLVVIQLLSFSILSLGIGVLSLYVGRLYRLVSRRPWSVIEVKADGARSGVIPVAEWRDDGVYWPGQPSRSVGDDALLGEERDLHHEGGRYRATDWR